MMAIVSPTASRVARTAATPSSSRRGSTRIFSARYPSSRIARARSARSPAGTQRSARGIGGDPIQGAPEKRRDRQPGDLARDVPERDLEGPVPPGVEVDRLEGPDVARDREWVLPEEQVLEGLEAVHRVARPDAGDALVGLDPDDRDRERGPRVGVPGCRERRIERHAEPIDADRRDLHAPASIADPPVGVLSRLCQRSTRRTDARRRIERR